MSEKAKRPDHYKPRTRTASQTQKLLTVPQGAGYSGIPERTLLELVAAGRLPKVQFGARRIWLLRSDLDAFISASREVVA